MPFKVDPLIFGSFNQQQQGMGGLGLQPPPDRTIQEFEQEPEPIDEQGIIADFVDKFQQGAWGAAADVVTGARGLLTDDQIWEMEQALRDRVAAQEDTLSTAQKEADANFSMFGTGDKEFTGRGFGGALFQGAGSLIPSVGLGLATGGVGALGSKALGMGSKLGQVAGGGLAGAPMIGGGAMNQVREELDLMPAEELANLPNFDLYYQTAMQQNPDDPNKAMDMAREIYTQDAEQEAVRQGAALGAVTMGAAVPMLDKVVRGGAGFLGGAKRGAGTEFLQEGAESGGQEAIVNPIVGREQWEGVPEAAGTGAILGGLIGGGLGGLGGLRSPNEPNEPDDTGTAPYTETPLIKGGLQPVDSNRRERPIMEPGPGRTGTYPNYPAPPAPPAPPTQAEINQAEINRAMPEEQQYDSTQDEINQADQREIAISELNNDPELIRQALNEGLVDVNEAEQALDIIAKTPAPVEVEQETNGYPKPSKSILQMDANELVDYRKQIDETGLNTPVVNEIKRRLDILQLRAKQPVDTIKGRKPVDLEQRRAARGVKPEPIEQHAEKPAIPADKPISKKGRDEKYGIDVELSETKDGYVVKTSDPNERDTEISSGIGGVYQNDHILNQEGELVPASNIVQGGINVPMENTPFKGTKEEYKTVKKLLADIDFARNTGDMDAVEKLENELVNFVTKREQPDTPAPEQKQPKKKLKDVLVDEDGYHSKLVEQAYAHSSNSPGRAATIHKREFNDQVDELTKAGEKLAKTQEQKEALNLAVHKFKNDYLENERSVMNARSGVVSAHIAGRSKFNAKQAGKRGNALDRAQERFNSWLDKAKYDVEKSVQDARTPEAVKADRKEATAKREKATHTGLMRDIASALASMVEPGMNPAAFRPKATKQLKQALEQNEDETLRLMEVINKALKDEGGIEKAAGKRSNFWKMYKAAKDKKQAIEDEKQAEKDAEATAKREAKAKDEALPERDGTPEVSLERLKKGSGKGFAFSQKHQLGKDVKIVSDAMAEKSGDKHQGYYFGKKMDSSYESDRKDGFKRAEEILNKPVKSDLPKKHWGIVRDNNVLLSGSSTGTTKEYLDNLAKETKGAKVLYSDESFNQQTDLTENLIVGHTWDEIQDMQQKRGTGKSGVVNRIPDDATPERDEQGRTEAQKEAGNYKKKHITWNGLDISIENEKGTKRSGTDEDGKAWETTMDNDYGYIKRTEGADGDHVDVFVGPNQDSNEVFIVNQTNKDKKTFDEHKVMLGFDNAKDAEKAYLANYENGWNNYGEIAETTVDGFKTWLKEDTQKKPAKFDNQEKYFTDKTNNIKNLTDKELRTELNKANDSEKISGDRRSQYEKDYREALIKESYERSGEEQISFDGEKAPNVRHTGGKGVTRTDKLYYNTETTEKNGNLILIGEDGKKKLVTPLAYKQQFTPYDEKEAVIDSRWIELSQKNINQLKKIAKLLNVDVPTIDGKTDKDSLLDNIIDEETSRYNKTGELPGIEEAEPAPVKETKPVEFDLYAESKGGAYEIISVKKGEKPRSPSQGVKQEKIGTATQEQWDLATDNGHRIGRSSVRQLKSKLQNVVGPAPAKERDTLKKRLNRHDARMVKLDNAKTFDELDAIEKEHKADKTNFVKNREFNEHLDYVRKNFVEQAPEYTIDQHNKLVKKLNSGDMSIDEFKEAVKNFRDNKDNIMKMLNSRQFTIKQLRNMAGYMMRGDEKKAEIADNVFDRLQTLYLLDNPRPNLTWTMGISNMQKGVDEQQAKINKLIDGATQEDLDNYAKGIKEAQAKREADKKAREEAVKDPKTLDDYREFVRVKGKDALKGDQLEAYDRLITAEMIARRKEAADREASRQAKSIGDVDVETAETKHTKTGEDLYVVKLADRIDRERFNNMRRVAKQYDGYYSRYSAMGAIPGFQFKSEANRDEFIAAVSTGEVKTEAKPKTNQERIGEMGDRLIAKGEESLNQDRQTNTARRAGMAASAEAAAESNIITGKLLKAIADADTDYLQGITALTQLEELQKVLNRAEFKAPDELKDRDSMSNKTLKEGVTLNDYIEYAEFPDPIVRREGLASLAKDLQDKTGYKALAKSINSVLKNTKSEDINLDNYPKIDQAKIKKYAKLPGVYGSSTWIADYIQSSERLEKIGITSLPHLRMALRELNAIQEKLSGVSPEQKQAKKIKTMERDLVGKKLPGFFPTPAPVINRMMDEAQIGKDDTVLEPSAGKGDIADAIKEYSDNVDTIEIASGPREILEAKGHNVVANDFLDYKGKKYDKIVMNPPFEKFQDIDHVRHAYDLLNDGGQVVAIMGAGVNNSRKKAADFRQWVEEKGGTIEELPADSFKGKDAFRTTGVNTVLVTIPKESGADYSKPTKKPTKKPAKKPAKKKPVEHPDFSFTGNVKPEGLSERQVFDIINDTYGSPMFGASKFKNVDIINDPNAKWRGKFQGGKITLNAHYLSKNDVIRVLHHEKVHEYIKQDPRFRKIANDIIKRAIKNPNSAAGKALEIARNRVPKNSKDYNRKIFEETMAYLAQYYNKPEVKNIFKKIADVIAKIFRGKFGIKMNETDAVNYLEKMVKAEATNAGDTRATKTNADYSVLEDILDDFTVDGNKANYTIKRMFNIIKDYAYPKGNVKATVAYVNPKSFIKATSNDPESIYKSSREYYNLEKLEKNTQTPFIKVEREGSGYKIIGHEGRHRMAYLADRGITKAPIVIQDYSASYDDYQTNFNNDSVFNGQWERTQDLPISEPVGISFDNVDTLQETFADQNAEVQFSALGNLTLKQTISEIDKFINKEKDLSIKTDNAYKAGNIDKAESLDAELAEVREQLDSMIAEAKSDYSDDIVDNESNIEEEFINLWTEYKTGSYVLQDKEDLIERARGILVDYGNKDKISDKELLKLVENAYVAKEKLVTRKDDAEYSALDDINDGITNNINRMADNFESDWFNNARSYTKRHLWGALNVRQIAEVLGKYAPIIKNKYIDRFKLFEADMNKMKQKAGEIANARQDLPKKENEKLAETQHEATIEGFDPSVQKPGDKDKVKIDKQKARLKEHSDKPPAYLEKVQNTLDIMIEESKENIKREQVIKDKYDSLTPAAKKIYKSERDYHRNMHNMRLEELKNRINDIEGDEGFKEMMIDKLTEEFSKASKNGPYFPLARFGQFWVSSQNADGEKSFDMFENETAQQRFVEELRSTPGEDVLGAGRQLDKLPSVSSGIDGKFIAEVDKLVKQAGGDDTLRDDIFQLYLESLPELSSRKKYLHRKKTKGFSKDQAKAFAHAARADANDIARIKHIHVLQGMIDDTETALNIASSDTLKEQFIAHTNSLQRALDETPFELTDEDIQRLNEQAPYKTFQLHQTADPEKEIKRILTKEKSLLRDASKIDESKITFVSNGLSELKASHEAMVNSNTHPIASGLNSLGFLWYLGASPAAALVNLTQTPVVALPMMLTDKALKGSAGHLSKAVGDFLKGKGTIEPTLNKKEKEAFKFWHDSGLLENTQAHDLSGIADSGIDTGTFKNKAMRAVSFMFHRAEVMNREVTALATYRAAIEGGMDHKDAMKKASDLTWDSHLDYGASNRARFMRGNFARVITQFKQYSQGITYIYARTAFQAFKGENKADRQQGMKLLGLLMGSQLAVAGTLGLPMAGIIMGMAQGLEEAFGDDDDPVSVKAEFRQAMSDFAGTKGGQAISHGLIDAFTPLSVSGRLSMADLWVRTPDFDLEGKSEAMAYLEALGGPMVSLFTNMFMAKQSFREGNFLRAAEQMTPKIVKDFARAGRYSTEGNLTKSGLKVKDMSPAEIIAQALGFSSSEVSEIRERATGIKNIERKRTTRRKDIMDAWMAGDDVTEEIQEWNRIHTRDRITGDTLRRANRSKMRYARQVTKGVRETKRNRDLLERYDY